MLSYNRYTDNELAELLKKDDHAAYTEIYHRYSRLLYLHAYKRLKDREQARDVVQDLFTVLWNNRSDFKLNTFLSGYLYTAIRNRIIKIIAHKDIESEYFSSLEPFIQDTVAADYLVRKNDLEVLIETEINALPEKMREIFKLSRKSHLSHKQIAEKLNLSEATVKKQVNNALKVLRVKLGPYLFIALIFLY